METVSTPRQIVDKIKKHTKPRTWSKDLRNWYVAEIVDLVRYNSALQKKEILKGIEKEVKKWFDEFMVDKIVRSDVIGITCLKDLLMRLRKL